MEALPQCQRISNWLGTRIRKPKKKVIFKQAWQHTTLCNSRKLFEKGDNGIALFTGDASDLIVVDCDVLKPKDLDVGVHCGKLAFDSFVKKLGLPETTPIQETASGGRHYFFSMSKSILISYRNRTSKLHEKELDLLKLFWKSGNKYLRKRLLELDNERKQEDEIPVCVDLQLILSGLPSGSIITKPHPPVGRPIDKKNRHGPWGYKDKTVMMFIKDVGGHLGNIRKEGFEPSSYTRKGYALYGSIRTDGFRLQLLAMKLKELQSARYKRHPEKYLPKRFTSTAGGLDYYLTEIRNVVKTKENVEAIWGKCEPENIKILGLDIGQAYIVGAIALLPNAKKSKH